MINKTQKEVIIDKRNWNRPQYILSMYICTMYIVNWSVYRQLLQKYMHTYVHIEYVYSWFSIFTPKYIKLHPFSSKKKNIETSSKTCYVIHSYWNMENRRTDRRTKLLCLIDKPPPLSPPSTRQLHWKKYDTHNSQI